MTLDKEALKKAHEAYRKQWGEPGCSAMEAAITAYLSAIVSEGEVERGARALVQKYREIWPGEWPAMKEARDLSRACLIAAGHIPEKGWKLVPVEPTVEMIEEAALTAVRENHGIELAPSRLYRAMLAAAPSPPSEE